MTCKTEDTQGNAREPTKPTFEVKLLSLVISMYTFTLNICVETCFIKVINQTTKCYARRNNNIILISCKQLRYTNQKEFYYTHMRNKIIKSHHSCPKLEM